MLTYAWACVALIPGVVALHADDVRELSEPTSNTSSDGRLVTDEDLALARRIQQDIEASCGSGFQGEADPSAGRAALLSGAGGSSLFDDLFPGVSNESALERKFSDLLHNPSWMISRAWPLYTSAACVILWIAFGVTHCTGKRLLDCQSGSFQEKHGQKLRWFVGIGITIMWIIVFVDQVRYAITGGLRIRDGFANTICATRRGMYTALVGSHSGEATGSAGEDLESDGIFDVLDKFQNFQETFTHDLSWVDSARTQLSTSNPAYPALRDSVELAVQTLRLMRDDLDMVEAQACSVSVIRPNTCTAGAHHCSAEGAVRETPGGKKLVCTWTEAEQRLLQQSNGTGAGIDAPQVRRAPESTESEHRSECELDHRSCPDRCGPPQPQPLELIPEVTVEIDEASTDHLPPQGGPCQGNVTRNSTTDRFDCNYNCMGLMDCCINERWYHCRLACRPPEAEIFDDMRRLVQLVEHKSTKVQFSHEVETAPSSHPPASAFADHFDAAVADGASSLVDAKNNLINRSRSLDDVVATLQAGQDLIFPIVMTILAFSLSPLVLLLCCSCTAAWKYKAGKMPDNPDEVEDYEDIPYCASCTWCWGLCWITYIFLAFGILRVVLVISCSACVTVDDMQVDTIRGMLSTGSEHPEYAHRAMVVSQQCLSSEHAATTPMLDVFPSSDPAITLKQAIVNGGLQAAALVVGNASEALRHGGVIGQPAKYDRENVRTFMNLSNHETTKTVLDSIARLGDMESDAHRFQCWLFDSHDGGTCDPKEMTETRLQSDDGIDYTYAPDCVLLSNLEHKRDLCDATEFKQYMADWPTRITKVLARLDNAELDVEEYKGLVGEHVIGTINDITDEVTCGPLHQAYVEFLGGICYQSVWGFLGIHQAHEAIGLAMLLLSILMYALWHHARDQINAANAFIATESERLLAQKNQEPDFDETTAQPTSFFGLACCSSGSKPPKGATTFEE